MARTNISIISIILPKQINTAHMLNTYYPIILAIFAAAAAGLVGAFALMKRTILAGDVMSHIAIPGLGLAIVWKINPRQDPFLGINRPDLRPKCRDLPREKDRANKTKHSAH